MKIDPDRLTIKAPVFYAAALRDFFPDVGKTIARKFCANVRSMDFDTDHWIGLAARDKVNKELLEWIKTDVEDGAKE